MKLGNIDVKFSFTDADDLERFESAAKKVQEKTNNYEKKDMSMSEAIKKECEIIEEFFDEAFGEKTSEKLFKGKKDLTEHMNMFMDIVNEKTEQTKGFQNMYENIQNGSRYMPNREQRRYNQYHKKGRR